MCVDNVVDTALAIVIVCNSAVVVNDTVIVIVVVAPVFVEHVYL